MPHNNRQFPGVNKTPEIFEFSLHNINEATNIDITQFTVIGSVLVKSSNLIKHGKRLENMSWRIMGKNLVSDKSDKVSTSSVSNDYSTIEVDEKFKAKKGLVPQYVFQHSVNVASSANIPFSNNDLTNNNNNSASNMQSETKISNKKHHGSSTNAENFLTFSDFNSIASIVAQPSLIETLDFIKRTNSSSSIAAMNNSTNLHRSSSSSSSLNNLYYSSMNNTSTLVGNAGTLIGNNHNGTIHSLNSATTTIHSNNNDSVHPHPASTSVKSRNALIGSRPVLKKNSSKGKLSITKNPHSLSTSAISSLLMKKSGSGAGTTTSVGTTKLVSNSSLQNISSYNVSNNHSIFNANSTNKLLPGNLSRKAAITKTAKIKNALNNGNQHSKINNFDEKIKSSNKYKSSGHSTLFDAHGCSKINISNEDVNAILRNLKNNNNADIHTVVNRKSTMKSITNSDFTRINNYREASHLKENISSGSTMSEHDDSENNNKKSAVKGENSLYDDELSNSDDSDVYSSEYEDNFKGHHPSIKKFISNDSFSEKLAQLKNEVGISEEQLRAARNRTLAMKNNNMLNKKVNTGSVVNNKKNVYSDLQSETDKTSDNNNNDKAGSKPAINTTNDLSNIKLLKRQSSLFANQKSKKVPSILLSDDSFSEEDEEEDNDDHDEEDEDYEEDDYDDDSSGNSSEAYNRHRHSLSRFRKKFSLEDKQSCNSQKPFNSATNSLINNSHHSGVSASTSFLHKEKQESSNVDNAKPDITGAKTANNFIDSDNDEWTDEDEERSPHLSGGSKRKSSLGDNYGEPAQVKRSLLSGLFLNELQKGYNEVTKQDIHNHNSSKKAASSISPQHIISPPKVLAGLGGRLELKNNTSKSSLVSKNSNTNKSIGSDQSKVVFLENGGLQLRIDNDSLETNSVNNTTIETMVKDTSHAVNRLNKSISGSIVESVESLRSGARLLQLPPVESMVTVNVEASREDRKSKKQLDRDTKAATNDETIEDIIGSEIENVESNVNKGGVIDEDDEDATSTKLKVTITGSMRNSDFENNHKLLRSYSSSSTVTGGLGNESRRGSTASTKSSFTNLLQLGFSVFGGNNSGNANVGNSTGKPVTVNKTNPEKNLALNNSNGPEASTVKTTSNAPDTAKSLLHTVYASHVFHQQRPPGVVLRGRAGINRGYGNTKKVSSINNNVTNSMVQASSNNDSRNAFDKNLNHKSPSNRDYKGNNGGGVKDVDIRNIVFGLLKNSQPKDLQRHVQHSDDEDNDNFDFDNYHNRGW